MCASVYAYGIKELDSMTRGYLTRYASVCYNRSRSDDNLQLDIIHKRHGWRVPLLVCYNGNEILDKIPSDVV